MRVLLDESVPRRLASAFPESFGTRTVQQMGWAGCSNGEMLRRVADHGFDVLVTVDQGFAYQQSVRDLPIPVVILIAGRTRLQELLPLVPEVIAVLSDDPARRIHRVQARESLPRAAHASSPTCRAEARRAALVGQWLTVGRSILRGRS